MAVPCRVCGKLSQDPEFCDFCNAELAAPPLSAPPSHCPLMPRGIVLSEEQTRHLTRPESSLLLDADEKTYRVHWIPPEEMARYKEGIELRSAATAASLPKMRVEPEGDGLWVFAEATARLFRPWENAGDADPLSELERLIAHAQPLAEAFESLHEQGLVGLRFHPRDLEEATGDDGTFRLRFTHLDLEAYRAGEYPDYLQLQPMFAPPEVIQVRGQDFGPRTDVYHLALFCYYWLARLLPDGFPGTGLETFHYHLPALRVYAPTTPIGVVAAINRGLAFEPHQRYAKPTALIAALKSVLEKARQRRNFEGSIAWEFGVHTRAGKAKSALHRPNEDSVFRKDFEDPPRSIVAVADGVTTCDIGSGALASLLTTIVLEHRLDNAVTAATFPQIIVDACKHASQTLLDWALEKGTESALRDGANLMGTTLNAAWIEGRFVQIANLGDSRAYLLDGSCVEQLTVDGDLGSGLLAAGAPPENVRNMGSICKALRECIGGCVVDNENVLKPLPDCTPTVTAWPVVPGDVVILCTDGLVEENIFLEPEILGEIVRTHGNLTAQQLAVKLTDAADDLQRLPSDVEPEGYGDNISCIVIRIVGA